MARWPFGPRKDARRPEPEDAARDDRPEADPDAAPAAAPAEPEVPAGAADAAGGTPEAPRTGPFDGDSVDFGDFDFRDFATGYLDLGSLRIPLPAGTQVQVEMGPDGPKMLHIVSAHGRITPVAFAAAASGGQWEESSGELLEGMRRDGLETDVETGPWGRELTGRGDGGTVRLIGVDGPRWMLRFMVAGPEGSAAELAALARELIARTFVYRGKDAILAGTSLPVRLPAELVQQLRQAMAERARQAGSDSASSDSAGPAPADRPAGGPDPREAR